MIKYLTIIWYYFTHDVVFFNIMYDKIYPVNYIR